MATMVKEKRREKKKSKEKASTKITKLELNQAEGIVPLSEHVIVGDSPDISEMQNENNPISTLLVMNIESAQTSSIDTQPISKLQPMESASLSREISQITHEDSKEHIEATYLQCNLNLEELKVTQDISVGSEAMESNLDSSVGQCGVENFEPSAPVFEEAAAQITYQIEKTVKEEVIVLKSMSLEEAMRQFEGVEMAKVMALSEVEEALVNTGPMSSPEHPLVDLLSTFRRALTAVERERVQIKIAHAEEAKFRSTLWKIDKRFISETHKCKCGLDVHYKAKYDHAELQTEKLPVACMKLKALLKNVQECYCHHLHSAILAYYQIGEYISEVVNGNKDEIREALSLVLQALKLSDCGPAVLATALQRWATALAHALVDQRDIRQLLFLIHHLFRQTRSVSWAAGIIDVRVNDSVGAARVMALIDVLFAKTALEPAVECIEVHKEDIWEEVDKDGGGGAVSENALRERDLLALLHALPLRDLVARILLFTQSDVNEARDYCWSSVQASGVMRACCGVRVLLHIASRVLSAHANYERLKADVRTLALRALQALAALHDHARASFSNDVEHKLLGELQAAFVSGMQVLDGDQHHELPSRLLADHVAKDYCSAHIAAVQQHRDDISRRVESLSIDLPSLPCSVRVRIVCHAALDRRADYVLARLVLDFLFHLAVRRNNSITPCKGACRLAGRDAMAKLLEAHPFLYPIALHQVAETNPVEKLELSSIECMNLEKWRPQCGEIYAVLEDWLQRCPHLLEPMLMLLNYEPHTGVSLDSQLVVGSWLRARAEAEWPWRVLRRLRLHHSLWGAPPPPDPDPDPTDLFSKAYALLATSWGHCLPLICSVGVEALCSIAATRTNDAVHCLAPIALVLASSPESVAATPRFADLFSMIITAGPGLMQRVIGRGGATGAELLLRLVREQLRDAHTGGVPRDALINLWICALWRTAASAALLDSALCLLPCWPQLQHYADNLALAQDEQSKQLVMQAMKWSSQAPLVAESALRAWHTQRELHTQLFPRLLDALHAQRTLRQRIHVNNALKMLRACIDSEELVIYRVSGAVLAAPLSHPALLLLWRLLMHLYLQRPPCDPRETTPPVGPLFFSGIINGGTFTQLKRRLYDNIKYHGDEAIRLKNNLTRNTPKPSTSRSESKSPPVDEDMTPPLSIRDVTGESDSSESEDRDDDTEDVSQQDSGQEKSDVEDMLAYHSGAERMFCEYVRWLEQGANTTAMPHHADVARFIPEQALQKAFLREADRRKPVISPDVEPVPLPPAVQPPPTPPPRVPFQDAKDALLKIKERRRKRSSKLVTKSLLSDTDIKDARKLLSIVHTNLKEIEVLAQEWCSEVRTVSLLDKSLEPLVRALRVPRPLPTLRGVCPNKCKPTEYTPQGREWCISTGAEKAIKENRKSAYAAIKKLTRSRPDAARRTATLLALTRRVGSTEVALRVVDSVWQSAGRVSCRCAPAADLLATMLELLADRWLVSNGRVCEDLLSRWSGDRISELQQRLLAALVVPQRQAPGLLPGLHAAVLRAPLPPHALFSCLSKFELSNWSLFVDSNARRSLLDALSVAAQRWAPSADQDHQLLLELVGVQIAAVCSPAELSEVVRAGVCACVQGSLPASQLRHIVTAARKCALHLHYDQLGHLLRELGVLWWEARTKLKACKTSPSVYASHMAELLQVLHSAFVATAVHLSYAPEKVATVSWSTAQEAWSPWVLPHVLPPLLTAAGDDPYGDMLKLFVQCLRQVMTDCPGTEGYLLGHVFEWVIQTHGSVYNCTEARVQLSALLAEVDRLPWDRQWLRTAHIQALVQISQCNDKEVQTWCAACVRTQGGQSWLDGAEEQLSVHLAALLYLFTTSPITFHQETLDTACRLPWHRLPELALDEVLERFFAQNHGLVTPYHELPQFRVILSASEIHSAEGTLSRSEASKQKRCRVTSLWTRATSAPALLPLAAAHASAILTMLADIACLIDSSEMEQLLERALVIMCIEPAASAVIPTWEKFITGSDAQMLRAILVAVAGLTVFGHFATLADVAIKTYLAQECGDWPTVVSVWRRCLWLEPTPLCARARLHAAYAALRTDRDSMRTDRDSMRTDRDSARTDYGTLRTALLALLAADINFGQNEAIVSVWICVSCLAALSCGTAGEAAECGSAARALLTRWGAKRPLLSLGGDSTRPTARHRLLCLLALCVLSPGDETLVRTYESACSSVLGSSPDVAAWGKTPHPRKLLRLATRLYPQAEKYFKKELDLTPEDSG